MLAGLTTAKNLCLGLTPWVPWDGRYGLGAITAVDLTAALGAEVRGAEVDRIEVLRDPKGTTDRARVRIAWNEAGRVAGLPEFAFAKGTPSQVSTRILNATFGLCESEVNFYNLVQPSLPGMTLQPYYARLGAGGRFLIMLESHDESEVRFFQPHDEAPLEHAEAIIDVLARMHAQFADGARLATDLCWVTTYNGRPGQSLAPTLLAQAEKRFMRRDGIPEPVRRLTRFHLENATALWDVWEALPATLCHGDSHIGNTFRTRAGESGLFDWQQVYRGSGMRDIAYFIAWAFSPEDRRKHERTLVERYLNALAAAGVADVPGFEDAWDLYRFVMIDAWTSVWAPLAIGGMDQPGEDLILLERMYSMLLDLDVEGALHDAIARR
jgi:hypothetical protein